MKNTINILLLVVLFIPVPAIATFNLFGYKRYVVVQVRQEHGAVVIGAKKVRVPYTMQETAIPTQADGLIEYLFLGNYQISLMTALIELVMGALLVFIYYVNTVKSRWLEYRAKALKGLFLTLMAFVLSEVISFYVFSDWIVDVKNGVNGNPGLFGVNATFPYANFGLIKIEYHPVLQLFIIPLAALMVILRNPRNKEEQVA